MPKVCAITGKKTRFQKTSTRKGSAKKKGGVGTEHIDKKVFLDIAQKHKVKSPEKLLKDLHALGISLWYDSMEQYQTLILNPEWISEGVYKIINWVN